MALWAADFPEKDDAFFTKVGNTIVLIVSCGKIGL